jgi:hypothetical protein
MREDHPDALAALALVDVVCVILIVLLIISNMNPIEYYWEQAIGRRRVSPSKATDNTTSCRTMESHSKPIRSIEY